MHWTIITAALLTLGLSPATVTAASSTPADDRKPSESTGITVDDLGRGLKSAAKNIENEIPKIGSAIGSAVKKITEKGSENTSSRKPANQDKVK
jgi:peptidoglycan hydrolase CwlO-like protein